MDDSMDDEDGAGKGGDDMLGSSGASDAGSYDDESSADEADVGAAPLEQAALVVSPAKPPPTKKARSMPSAHSTQSRGSGSTIVNAAEEVTGRVTTNIDEFKPATGLTAVFEAKVAATLTAMKTLLPKLERSHIVDAVDTIQVGPGKMSRLQKVMKIYKVWVPTPVLAISSAFDKEHKQLVELITVTGMSRFLVETMSMRIPFAALTHAGTLDKAVAFLCSTGSPENVKHFIRDDRKDQFQRWAMDLICEWLLKNKKPNVGVKDVCEAIADEFSVLRAILVCEVRRHISNYAGVTW